ncbi:pentapeptide repeat-containing protein [Paenibacillus polymyxa]|uniref:pentapeptide repeat-containing protein n=1 Tax=Paenibacillus polymyxa TaxID=1406 RepID=UPI00046F3615|nr:pentapeptide repeat-containing protein [Paenibacillus polymyxa]
MKRQEALLHLRENSVLKYRVEQIAALHEYLIINRDELARQILSVFKDSCIQALNLQKKCDKGKIQHIHFTFFRHRVINHDASCRIYFYDHQGYMDSVECAKEFNANWVFKFLDIFERQLTQDSKKYVNKIYSADISQIKREEASFYVNYMANLIRHVMKDAVETDEFLALGKDSEVYIRVGEYKDFNELVYKFDSKEQQSAEVRSRLDSNENDQYAHESFKNVDLSHMYFKLVNLCYSHFSKTSLVGSYLVGCPLIGADFRSANLQETSLDYSLIHGADFRGANLCKAQLEEVQGSFVVPTEKEFHIPPFMETNFAGANLEDASFKGADLRGANFRGALLKQTDFSQANLEGASFYLKDIQLLKLNDQQLDGIQVSSND